MNLPNQLILATLIALSNIFSYYSTALAQPHLQSYSAALPAPPDTGTPLGSRTPGGTRPQIACQQKSKPLTALAANNGKDFTISEYPTFWFYIPYTAAEVNSVEFALKDVESVQTRTVYRTAVQLPEQAGIIKITIPEESQYALEANKNYRWELMLSCGQGYEPNLNIDGWVQKIDNKSQLETIAWDNYLTYREQDIWYDAIDTLAKLHFTQPENSQLSQAWSELLQVLNLQELTEESLVSSQQIPSEE